MKRVSNRKLRRAAQAAQSVVRAHARKPRPLGVSLARFSSAVAVASALFASATHADAANRFWDPGLTGTTLGGGPGTWDLLTANWYDLTSDVVWNNANLDTAVFGGPTPGVVTLGAPITVGGLTFNTNGYELTSDTLTISAAPGVNSPSIAVIGTGSRAVIGSTLAGSNGFTKIGAGALALNSLGNTITGDIAIKDGSVVITNQNQLGAGSTAISITGVANTGNPGFSGGSLVLAGTAGAGPLTITREISGSGRGPGAANASGALVSVGANTLAGNLTFGSTTSEGRLVVTHGNTLVTGGLTHGSGGATIIAGNGNTIISGLVTGSDASIDRFIRSGGQTIFSTTWLQNTGNNFAGSIRTDGGTVGGSVRATSNAVLGAAAAAVDFNFGNLELRSDSPDFSTRGIRIGDGRTGTIFVDRAIGGSGSNQNFVFGNYTSGNNNTLNIQSRNGADVSITGPSGTITWTNGNNTTYASSANGTFTINANISRASETNARTMVVNPQGEMVITGNLLQVGSGNVNLQKNSTGTLTLQGTATTFGGNTQITQGTLSIGNVGALATGGLSFGNSTTNAGTLEYTGAAATINKTITLNNTTANAHIYASGSGPLTVSGTITNSVAGSKTLVLGGTNTADNTITSVIPVNSSGTGVQSLQKIGNGTWVLAGTANNTFTGTTTVSGGILKAQEAGAFDILPDGAALIFGLDAFNQAAGGTFEYKGAPALASTEAAGALTATLGHGNLIATPGSGGSATITFSSLGARAAGASLNVSGAGAVNVTSTTGFVNSGVFFNSANFAFSGAGTTLRAPVYGGGGDVGFVNAAAGAATLTAASHNQITGAITAQTTAAINSLKNSGAFDLTLGAAQTLTIGTAAGTGILQTGGSAIISGGTAIAASAAANDFQVRVDGGANTLTINTPMTVSTAGLTKSGAGTLVLGGANTYSGTVSVNEGTLQMATGGLLGATNIGLSVRQNATFDLNGVSVGTLASGTNSVNALNGAGTITNTGALATLRVGNNNTGGYFTGPITGVNLSLIKNGSGTLSLTNNTSSFGALTISAGTVAFNLPEGTTTWNAGVNSPLGTGSTAAGLVFNGGALQYTGANGTIFSATQTPTVTTDREFTLAGNGTIDSTGRYGASTLINGGTNQSAIIFTNPAAVTFSGTGARTLTLQGDSTGDNELHAGLVNNGTDALSVTKGGGGLWHLTGTANTYSGATTITGGALQVAVANLSPNSNIVLNGGVLQTSGSLTNALGTAAGQIQFTGNGGFAAGSTPLTVNLGGGATLNLGTAPTAGSTLIFNSTSALADVIFQNPVNLGTAARTIQVDDNGTTGLDFATMTGLISGTAASGTAALTKTGGGLLILETPNTYSGTTVLNNGSLAVTSIGSAGATATSVGTNVGGGELQLGSAGNNVNLLYVGPGETATRTLRFVGATNNRTLDASGSGALVLTNVANSATGAITINLRGTSTDANAISGVLSNGGTNVTTVTKSDGGVWILNPSTPNTFTGTLTAGGGMLGLTSNGIGAAANLTFGNGGIFAVGGPLTTNKTVQGNNVTAVFGGTNSITLDGTVQKTAGNNAWNISNNIEGGALLTVNGNFVNLETANSQTINIRGTGSTVWNGAIQNPAGTSATTAWNIAIDSGASFTMGGTVSNTYTGVTTLSQGTLNLNKTGGASNFGGQLNFGGGVLTTIAPLTLANNVFLTGDPATFGGANAFTLNGNFTNNGGNRLMVDNVGVTLGGNVLLSNDGTNRTLNILGSGATSIPGVIANGSTSTAGALTYSGSGSLSLTGTNTAAGALTVNRSTVTLSGTAGNWAGGVSLNGGGTLTLDYTAANLDRVGGTFTGAGGTLNFIGNGAGTTESFGAATLNNNATTILMSGAGPNVVNFASATFVNSGSSFDLSQIAGLGTTNNVTFTTAPALTAGIQPRLLLGTDFATISGGSVQAYSSYNIGNDVNTAAATDTLDLTAATSTTSNRTVNALKLNGGVAVGGATSNRLTLTSGAILNTAGNSTLNTPEVAFGGAVGFLQVQSGTTLTVNSTLTGTGAWTKALPGTLQLNTPSFVQGAFNNVGGTVVLNGGLNTLFPSQQYTPGIGSTLDLNGNSQLLGILNNAGVVAGSSGTITNTGGASSLGLNMTGGGTFGGTISGPLSVGRTGNNGLTILSPQTYTGSTLLMANTTTLENDATLLTTSSIGINGGATLSLSNNSNLQTQNNNRIGDAIPLTLNGGTLSLAGRVATAATETLGAISSGMGANTLTVNTGGGTFGSWDVTAASLTRASGSTLNITGTNLGQQGNASRIMFDTVPTTIGGGALGAWAIANTTDYAAYNTALGVGVVGQGGFAGYSGSFASGNITEIPAAAATTTNLSGATSTGLLKISGAFTNDITFAAPGDTLTLGFGGILRSNNNNATNIGTTTTRGTILSGAPELVIYNNANTSGATAMTINSVIGGGGTALVKSGGGVLALTGVNTYGGGTTVSQGTLELRGTNTGDVVIPAGGLTITNATVQLFPTTGTNPIGAGQINSGNAVTLNGSSTLTLVGNNSLDSLNFNNNGGAANPTVNSGGILTLTNATPITTQSSNPATVATIAGNINVGSGAKTLNVPDILIGGNAISRINAGLNISANILSPGASFTKTGAGMLQLSGQSTFNGLAINSGGVILTAGSTPAQGGAGVTSGPLGVGPVTVAAGSPIIIGASLSLANDIAFAGTPIIDSTANTAWTLNLNGDITGLPNGVPTVNIPNSFTTVVLRGQIPNIGLITGFNKTGLGTLIFNSTGYTGDFNATALGNATQVQLLNDGDGTGSVQTIPLGNVVFDAGIAPNIIVDRAGGTLPFNLAANKILSPASISNVGSLGLTVTNNSGYGLEIAGGLTLSGTPTFTVANATASNVTQGLYLNGAVTGTGFNKAGTGTLVLGSAGNSFTGNVNIQNGVVSITSNGQLGNPANLVQLNPGAATTGLTSTLRAGGTFTLNNAVQLSNATANTRTIEVTGGNTLTLGLPLDLNAGAGATASLSKGDNGTLVSAASNSGWSGTLNINAGTVLINSGVANPFGTGTIAISPNAAAVGAALQLDNSVTVSNPINLQGNNNVLLGGINSGGQIQGISGLNVINGPLSIAFDGAIGANAGSQLDINSTVTVTGTRRVALMSEGSININGAATFTGNMFGLDKFGAGTLTISVPIGSNISGTGGFVVRRGTAILDGTATINSSGAANFVGNGATLTLDNSGTSTPNRLTGRAVTLEGGTFNYITNNSTEVAGALVINNGGSSINMTGSGTAGLTFSALTTNTGGHLNLTGTFGSATNFVKITAAPALTPAGTGILPRVTTSGNEFASYNSTVGLFAFTGYAAATNILSAGTTQTFRATPLTGNSLTGNQTLNALTLSSGAGSVNVGGLSGAIPTTLTLTTGAILANGSGTNTTLSVPVVAVGGNEAIIHVAAGQTLDITSGLTGTNGLMKTLPGTLNLNTQAFITGGNTVVNGGTLNLAAGTNTLFFGTGLGVNTGATVDLVGNPQYVGGLFSQGAGGTSGYSGGIVTNTGAATTLTVNGNVNFAGTITGAISLNKTGTQAQNFQEALSYTGSTLISGGSVTLNDFGALPNTVQPIDINYGTLTLTNSNLTALSNRVNDAAPITLKGGTLNFGGRAQTEVTEVLGAVTLAQGNSSIFADDGGTGVALGQLTLASITRTSPTATLRFNNAGDFGAIGTRGRIIVTAAPGLTNNIIGPWAVVDREWASYDSTYGIGALNQTGFAGYAGSGLNSGPLATDNVRFSATGTTILAANTTLGTLNFAQQNAATTLDLGGNTLTVQGGGILFGQATDNVNFAINNGTLTSGVLNTPSDFFLIQGNYGGTNRTVSINAAIADNGTGAVRLIKASGQNDGVLTLEGTNTYTGGTVVNAGTLALGATSTLGSGGITVYQGTLTQTAGSIIPAQSLTLGGGSVVTLANQANTLSGITVDNMGGAAPTLTPTGTLTLTGPIAVTTMNAGGVATIGTGTLNLNGAAAYSINVGAVIVNGIDVAPWQSGLTINSNITNANGIAKSGAGVLTLAGVGSDFGGGVNVSAGGLIIGASSTPNGPGDTVTAGPLGTGTLTMGANTTLLSTNAANTISNLVTFTGDTTFNGINNLTLNGDVTLPSIWNATVTAPQMTVNIANVVGELVTDVINKSGLGILNVGNYDGTINVTGGLSITADGNTLSTVETITGGGALVITGDTSVTVNRAGAVNARNKIIERATLTIPGNIMSVNNLSGYGLGIAGATTMTGPSHFAVNNATASNVVQGLYLNGVVDDGASTFGLIKSGPGALVLGNAGNTFGGVGQTIEILNGIVSIGSDGALGDAANSVTLSVDGSTNVGLRATGSFATGRTIILNQANNAIEVTAGNVFTVSNPFSIPTATNTLTKNDNGVLEIAGDNTGWASTVTVNAGSLRLSHNNALGTSAINLVTNNGSALQLSGGVSIANALTNSATNGINGTGGVYSVSGSNTYTGLITVPGGIGSVYGAAAGATLNINGGIATSNSATFFADAGGIVNLNSLYGNGTAGGPTFVKTGAGTLNVTVDQPAVNSAVNVNAGTLNIVGTGVRIGSTSTAAITIGAGGTFIIDDASFAPSGHLGARPVTLQGGTFSYLGNALNSTETTAGALTFSRMSGIFQSTTGGGTNTITFGSLALGGDATANFEGVGLGTAANRVLFTTAPTLSPATTGILSRATVNGADFATYNGTVGITAFTGYNVGNNPNTAAATDTLNLTAAANITANRTLNALKISGATPVTLSGDQFRQLTLTAGGILATGATTHQITAPVINNGATQIVTHVDTGSSLNISSTLVGTGNIVKDGAGTLTISSPASNSGLAGVNGNTVTGVLTVARGTLALNGGNNTLTPNQFIVMGGPAATLDLGTTSQQISGLLTDTTTPGSGGIVTGAAGSQLVISQDNTARTFAGSLTGALNLVRSGQNTLTLANPNNYTGSTLVNAGGLTLLSDGTLASTSAITINHATLTADNTGVNDLGNRINDTAPISLNAATLTLAGRAQTASSETLGAVSAVTGFNVINPNVGGTGVNSMDVSLASLSRPANSTATLIVQGTNLGTIGSNSRVTVGTLNGVATAPIVYSPNGSGMTNNLVGGWAISSANEFLTYIPGLGLASLNQVGAPQYDLNNTFTGSTGTDNIRLTATTAIPNGGAVANAVSMSGSAINLTFATGTDTLNITSGGLIGPNNNQSIGATLDSGRLTAGGTSPALDSNLYVFNRANTLTINSRIVDNTSGGGSSVRAVFTASGGAITLVNPNNSYTGGTTLNGGTLNLTNTAATPVIPAAANPANGLVIDGGTVTMNNFAGQIAASNIVTVRNAVLNLFGNNTLAGVVMNNIGGTGNPTLTTFNSGAINGDGTLTIGASGITATSSNVATTNIISGRINLGAGLNTVNIDPIMANGVDIAPLNATIAVQGITGSAGGFNKTGNGVFQFNAQSNYTGPTNVNAGSIRIGLANGGSRHSAYTLAGGTFLNLAGASTVLGSLAGAGTVFNSGGNATLTVGFNDSSTTFSGEFRRFNDASLAGVSLTKIGNGNLTLTAAQTLANGSVANITVGDGTLTYSGAGAAFPATTVTGGATMNVGSNATLALDNSGTNVNNRLGLNAVGSLTLAGGNLSILGNSAAPTSESVLTFNINNGGSRIELDADAAQSLTLALGTLSGQNNSGSLVLAGITGAAAGADVANVTITTPTLIGGQGTGANGSNTMPVRSDILADRSVSGLGEGFLVRDTVTNNYRALGFDNTGAAVAGEFETTANTATATNWAGTENVKVTGTVSIFANTPANTLTFQGTNTLGSGLGSAFGIYSAAGALLTQNLSNATGILGLDASATTINVGNVTPTTAGTTMSLHVVGTGSMTISNFYGIGSTAGLIKSDGGTLNLNNRAFYTGVTTINGGTVNLSPAFDNTIAVIPGATTPTVSNLALNGTNSVINLNGRNQTVGTLTSSNALAGQGGSVTNTGAAATITSTGGGTFAGNIAGANTSFTRSGNNTTLLTNANTYGGATVIRGGVLQLRDEGSILNTSSISNQYGTLQIDQSGLNTAASNNPTRVSATTVLTMQGGGLTLTPAGSTDAALTLNTVALTGGANTITPTILANQGATTTITIGNLQTTALNTARGTLNVNAAVGIPGINQARTFFTQINGVAPTNNAAIAPNIIVNNGDFAAYLTDRGVGALGQAGFPAYGAALASGANTGTVINNNTGALAISANTTSGSLKIGNTATTAVTFTAGTEVLNLALGGLLSANNNNAVDIGTPASRGVLTTAGTATSGTVPLYTYQNQNTTTINSIIANNGAGALTALVKSGAGTLTLTAPNTYTGGTFVNQGTLNLTATTPGNVVIPGNLTINNATVTQNTNNQQIATTADVTINGGGALNLSVSTNTLNSVTFNNTGGTGNPTVNGGAGLLTLAGANPITATNDSFATTPVVSGAGGLTFSNAAPVITVSGLSTNSLNISAVISGANPISKAGTGALALTAANTFTGGFTLNAGSVIFGNNNAVGTNASVFTINGAGATILSDGTVRTIPNPVTVGSDFTFGGVTAGNSVTLGGAVSLGATGRTLTVSSPAATATINGAITSTATSGVALTKAGPGIMVLGNATNNFNGLDVAVTGGVLKNGLAAAIPDASGVAVSTGAGWDLNNFDETVDRISGTGFITQSGNAVRTLTVSSTTNSSTFAGVLTDNRLAQSLSRLNLVKAGAGTTLTLTGVNTHNNTTINDGTIAVSGGAALPDTGAVTIANTAGATLLLNNNETIGSLAGGGATGGLVSLGANTLTTGDATNTNYSGVISGAGNTTTGSLVKVGTGSFTLDGTVANTYTGLTTVNGGSLILNKTGVNAIAGPVTADKVTDLQVNGGGTVTWSQSNQLGDTVKIQVASGGTVNFNNFDEDLYDLVSAGTVNYGTGTINIDDPTWLVGSTNTIGGTTRFGNLIVNGGTNNINAGPANLQVGSGNLTFADPDVADLGARNITIASSNSTPGNLRLGRTTVPNENVTVFFTGTGTTTATISSGGVGTNAGTLDLGDGGTGANRTFNIGQNGSTTDVDLGISAQVIGNAGVGLTKTGSGTMQLSATANSYTGPTVVNGGTLDISGSITGTTNVQITSGTLLLSGGSERVNDAAGVNLNGGTLALANGLSAGTNETLGTLTLSGNSVIDFGASSGLDLSFTSWTTFTSGSATLSIQGWNGTANVLGTDNTDDRLIFTGSATTFMSEFGQSDISFAGFGTGYQAIQFGGQFEIVPVPEPSSTALLGAMGLLGLIGYRERRRLSSALSRKTKQN